MNCYNSLIEISTVTGGMRTTSTHFGERGICRFIGERTPNLDYSRKESPKFKSAKKNRRSLTKRQDVKFHQKKVLAI